MNLTILSTLNKRTVTISWIEVETAAGNFVIQQGHIPTILIVAPNKPITIFLASGKQETFSSNGGILEVRRDAALLLLNEA